MAICSYCRKEMLTANSCLMTTIVIDGKGHKPIPYGEEQRINWESERCHDCNVERGGFHHSGCDVEECPSCHGQIISCGCLDDDDDEEEGGE